MGFRVTAGDLDAVDLLRAVGHDPGDVVELVGGHWSRAFRFESNDRRLVARFNRDGSDLRKDVLAQRWDAPALPVPMVVTVDEAAGWTIVVTEFAEGIALERVDRSTWERLVPRVADLLDSLRTASPAGAGWGPWSADGTAEKIGWSAWLLGVGSYRWVVDHSDWRAAAADHLVALFDDGRARLAAVADDTDVSRSLVHADLVHDNVKVTRDRVTGVFDWQCAAYGDHLYDLAWLEFFEPWHPGHDASLLIATLADRWRRARATPDRWEQRREACLLHIGLDHLVYGVQHGTAEDADAMAERLRALVPSLR